MSNADVVRTLVQSYLAQDRATADRLIADDFVFTSPQDDHIDRATFFERCFPATTQLGSHQLLQVVPTEGEDVFILYEYASLQTGDRYRNTEVHTVRSGQVVEIQVFFGGRVA